MGHSVPVSPPDKPLRDGFVVLRMQRASDVEAIASASSDPQTRRWLSDPPVDEAARLTSVVRSEEVWRGGQGAPLVMADVGTDGPIGLINLQFRDDDVGTIAYSVFPKHRGKGIAGRAVCLVTEWALRDLGMDRVLLEVDAENITSVRVAEKCKFQRLDSRTETRARIVDRTIVIFVKYNVEAAD
jgi:RimJ/RimL family protein N-acetyltransferase